jgi:hypothetical protein
MSGYTRRQFYFKEIVLKFLRKNDKVNRKMNSFFCMYIYCDGKLNGRIESKRNITLLPVQIQVLRLQIFLVRCKALVQVHHNSEIEK